MEPVAGPSSERTVLQAFSKFDQNGDGTISRDELANVLKALDPKTYSDDALLDQMFHAADADRSGAIDYSEFVAWIFQDSRLTQVVAEMHSDGSSSDSEPENPRPAEATTTVELYELLTMESGRFTGLLEVRLLVDACSRFQDAGMFDLPRLVPQACGEPESAVAVTTLQAAHLCKVLYEAEKRIDEEELMKRFKERPPSSLTEEDVHVDVRACIGFRKFRILLRVLTNVMRVDRRHLCAHFAWRRTERFEMTQAVCDLFVTKCFLKGEGSRSRITANNFLRFCQAYRLVDEKQKVGLSYGSLGLWFRKLMDQMPQHLATREARRTKPRGEELRNADRAKKKSRGRRRSKTFDERDDDNKETYVLGIAQVSVMMEQFYFALPGGPPRYKAPLSLVLQLIEAEPADEKRRPATRSRSPSPAPGKPKEKLIGFSKGAQSKEAQWKEEARTASAGFYRISREGGAVVSETISIDSSELGVADKDITYSLLEVVLDDASGLVRARLEDPVGWITIFDSRTGERSADLIGII